MDFNNKNVLVCGMARSGISAALLLKNKNARVFAQDIKDRGALAGAAERLESHGVTVISGAEPDDALLNNMDMIVISPGVPSDAPFLYTAGTKKIPVLSEIELGYLFCAAPIIAITGTNGKTTTASLTGDIVKTGYAGAKTLGNIGAAFTSEVHNLTANDVAVLEVSSFQLEHTDRFKPKIAAVLNITPDHLDRHKTVENYIRLKERIFENQTPDDFLILNHDDPICKNMARKTVSQVVFFSRQNAPGRGVFIADGAIVSNINGDHVHIINTDDIRAPGGHILEDILASCAIAICLGIPASQIADTVKAFRGVTHRLEYVAEIGGVDYYNDSKATNPDAAVKGLAAMTRPVVLICGGYDKDSGFEEWTALFNKKVRHAVIIGATTQKIIDACEKNGFYNYQTASSLKEAVEASGRLARPGDAVLLSPACASWDMFKDFEERGKLFCEYIKK